MAKTGAAATENSGENRGGVSNLKPFEKGRSGNPGGRPKGLAKATRDRLDKAAREGAEQTGSEFNTGADLIVGFWSTVMTDSSWPQPLRMRASENLAERGWGKPAQFVPIEDDDPLELSDQQTDDLAAAFDDRLDELEARRRGKTATG